MKAKNKWLEIRESINQSLLNKKNIFDAKNILLENIEIIQHEVMSEEKNIKLRQQIGIIFTMLKENLNLYNTIGETIVWSNENNSVKNSKLSNIFTTIFHCGLIYSIILGGFNSLKNKYYFISFTFFLSFICEIILLFFIIKKYKTISSKIEKNQKTEINIDINNILNYMDNSMESIDRYIEEFKILNNLENKSDGKLNNDILMLFQKIDEADNTKNENIISSLNKEIQSILLENNIEKISYSNDKEKYFDILPSKNSSMTIKSAFIDKSNNKILVRGIATKKIN
ncbi:hypothetical protein [Fusobacterium perfoetens]|uniref:hypothetical protein n=1 Tax=Fusobacterium perfoetens TaxID=852 RepID=UPI00047F70A6|nr:hypothetical protein [Fusobacterium perfoetens]MCI6153301.1 hypothetical protein [Fusobacterium perfoetens]MDY3237819.1 hypothetical protein [Fusobacterium perfoetens]